MEILGTGRLGFDIFLVGGLGFFFRNGVVQDISREFFHKSVFSERRGFCFLPIATFRVRASTRR
jgi:hypothetical protein